MRTASMSPVRAAGFFEFLSFLAVHFPATDCMTVIVGDPFEVPENCEPGESGSLLRDLGDDGTRQVATYQHGQWTVSPKYRDLMKNNVSKIVFPHTRSTDGGIYEVTCSKSDTKLVQLEVVAAGKLFATEGDNVTLRCEVKTIGGTGLTGWWEKNGKPLCVKNSNCRGTPADTLTESTDGITRRNVSLTFEGVQMEDSGDYVCYIQDGELSIPKISAAFRLTVNEKMINNSTAAPRNQTQSHAEHTQPSQISTWVISSVILLLVALVALCLWRRGKINCDSGKLYKLVERRCHASNSSEATTSV